jgi:hypothetical protein
VAWDEKWFEFEHVGKVAHFHMPQIQPLQRFSEPFFAKSILHCGELDSQ